MKSMPAAPLAVYQGKTESVQVEVLLLRVTDIIIEDTARHYSNLPPEAAALNCRATPAAGLASGVSFM